MANSYNAPPDDFILDIFTWLRNEIYPGLNLGTFDDRAAAVWVCGSRGYISIWQNNGYNDQPQVKHQDAKQKVYNTIVSDTQPRPPQEGGRLVGLLRVEGLGFRDDTGPVLPTLCHFGEAFSAYVRRPDSVRAELDRIAAAGYQGIRFWDILGYWDVAWAGKEVTPVAFRNHSGQQVNATPGYYSRLAEFLQDVKARGLKVHHSRGDMNSMRWDEIKHHVSQVGVIQQAVGLDTICFNEACNESWQNGVPEVDKLKELCNLMPEGPIRGTSAANDDYGGELPESVRTYTMDSAVIHGYRGGESHNRIGHIMAVGYETLPHYGYTGWQGEPAGPGSGVTNGQENHPEALCLMAAMAHSTHQGWVYMSSNGVFWNNSISTEAGFNEVARVSGMLPKDIAKWDVFHGGTRWRGKRILEANGDGTLRCDHMLDPQSNRFQVIVYGKAGTWNIPVERSFRGERINVLTGERTPIAYMAGQTWNVQFERGFIVQGELV